MDEEGGGSGNRGGEDKRAGVGFGLVIGRLRGEEQVGAGVMGGEGLNMWNGVAARRCSHEWSAYAESRVTACL